MLRISRQIDTLRWKALLRGSIHVDSVCSRVHCWEVEAAAKLPLNGDNKATRDLCRMRARMGPGVCVAEA